MSARRIIIVLIAVMLKIGIMAFFGYMAYVNFDHNRGLLSQNFWVYLFLYLPLLISYERAIKLTIEGLQNKIS